mgnify:CR=1 FL=1
MLIRRSGPEHVIQRYALRVLPLHLQRERDSDALEVVYVLLVTEVRLQVVSRWLGLQLERRVHPSAHSSVHKFVASVKHPARRCSTFVLGRHDLAG